MQMLCDIEAESLCGGLGISLPNIQITPNIIVNAVPQINAGTAIGVLGGSGAVDQSNGTFLWNNLTSLVGFRFRR
jgi:hypothetical protein